MRFIVSFSFSIPTIIVLMVCSTATAQTVDVPLNLSSGFNGDAIVSPGEYQQSALDGGQDYRTLYGNLPTPHGNWVLASNLWVVTNTSGLDNAYSIPSNWFHPVLLSGSDALPQNGLIVGSDRNYLVTSFAGNDLYSGNWMQAADPSTFTLKNNVAVIGAMHNNDDWQVTDTTIELPAEQKGQYDDVNFILNAIQSNKARGLQIIALYGVDGTDEQIIHTFNPDAPDGPLMADAAAPTGFAIAYSMNYHYSSYSGPTGMVITGTTANLFEFAAPLTLDNSKILWGFRIEDTNPTQTYQARGLTIWAATASRADTSGNVAPTANAGSDQLVYDLDVDTLEEITLDASTSSDDGVIVNHVWTLSGSQVAVGINPIITLGIGVHTLTLTAIDNHGVTDTDTVVITVEDRPATAPTANAGDDTTIIDDDGNGFADVTLDGSGSTDSNGSIVSWQWSQGMTNHGSGETLVVSLPVGVHTITLTVTDDESLPDVDTVLINVVDAPAFNVFYVDQSIGDDANPGTETQPWLTIQHAVDNVVYGDTILVKSGIYREAVRPEVSGLPGLPITLKAADGEHAIISGALEVTNWSQATQLDVNGNPNYGSIYYADISWQPLALYDDNQPLTKARTSGYWVPTADGTAATLIDSTNITQPDGYWNDAEIYLWITNGGAQYKPKITSHTGSTLTFSPALTYSRIPKPEDQYYIRNKVDLISSPGQWVVSDNGDGTYRLFVWTSDSADPAAHLIEASQWLAGGLFDWNDEDRWILDGFEIRHNESHGVSSYQEGAEYVTIKNCMIHHNEGTGIYSLYNNYGHIYRNYVGFNHHGIQTSDSHDVLIEENEVDNNWEDGIIVNGDNVTMRRNYVHGHWFEGHSDNLQLWDNVNNLTLEENFVINSGQTFMMQDVHGMNFTGNVFAGSHANMIIVGGDTDNGLTLHNNTLAYTPNQMVVTAGTDYDFLDNIFYHGTTRGMYYVDLAYGWVSDHNLFYTADGFGDSAIHVPPTWDRPFPEYQSVTGLDPNGAWGNPNFTNAPLSINWVNDLRVEEFTATRLYMFNMLGLEIGDHVEVDWDGVVRTITALGPDYIEVTPGNDFFFMIKAGAVLNWKTNTNFTLDLTPAPGSPAIGMASDGGTVGASISTVDFANADFDGDGTPNVWRWNKEKPTNPLQNIQAAKVFYNNSAFDGNDPAVNANDDNAIDDSKSILLPGQTATFANYTSYSKGINGLIIDILNTSGSLTAADFTFKIGNDSNPAGWTAAPTPTSVSVRPGQGLNASDRVTITFADASITKKWLQVTVEANANTNMPAAVTFYIGNAIGETGNNPADTIVNTTDEIACRNNPRNFMRPASADNTYDHNKDAKVNATDEIISRNNGTTMVNDLQLISP